MGEVTQLVASTSQQHGVVLQQVVQLVHQRLDVAWKFTLQLVGRALVDVADAAAAAALCVAWAAAATQAGARANGVLHLRLGGMRRGAQGAGTCAAPGAEPRQASGGKPYFQARRGAVMVNQHAYNLQMRMSETAEKCRQCRCRSSVGKQADNLQNSVVQHPAERRSHRRREWVQLEGGSDFQLGPSSCHSGPSPEAPAPTRRGIRDLSHNGYGKR